MSAKKTASRKTAAPPRRQRVTRAAPTPMAEEDNDDDLEDVADHNEDEDGDEEDVTERVNHEAQIGRGRAAQRNRFSRTSMSRAGSRRISGFEVSELREFMKEEDNVLPRVPDTKDWHYSWGRYRIGDKDDGSNIHDKLNGRMAYEVVTKDKLPPGFKLDPLAIKSGDHMGGYQYRDCILLRCPMINYRKWLAASELRSQQLNAMLDAGDQAARQPGEERTDFFVEQNREKTGTRREVYERTDA